MRRAGALLLALGGLYASSGACEPLPLGDGPRRAAIKATASVMMVPALEAFEAEAHALSAAIDAGDRASGQAAWRTARAAYKRVEPVTLGPALELRLAPRIDQWPVDPMRVLELADTATLTPAALSELGANRLGFHALEAVLFGDHELSGRLHQLASALASLMAEDATRLRAAWSDGYARRFGEIGASDAVYATAGAAVDALVNALVAHVEKMMATRLGKPLGHDSGGTALPALEESPLAEASIDDLLANLDGVERAYRVGLSPVVAARSVALDARVIAAIGAARAALSAVPRPFARALVENTADVEAAWAAVRALWVLLRTEVIGALGAVLKLNDNDGD